MCQQHPVSNYTSVEKKLTFFQTLTLKFSIFIFEIVRSCSASSDSPSPFLTQFFLQCSLLKRNRSESD